MSLFDSYVDGSTVLASLGKKSKVPLKAVQKKVPAKPKANPGPPVAQIEEEMGQPDGDVDAEMDAAVSAMDSEFGGGGEEPLEGGGGGGGDLAIPSAAAPAAEPAAPAAAETPAADPGYGPTSDVSNFRLTAMSRRVPQATGYYNASGPGLPRPSAPKSTLSTLSKVATAVVAPTRTVSKVASPVAVAPTRTATRVATTTTTAPTKSTALRTATRVRGDEPLPFIISSPIPGISSDAWTRFVMAIRNGAQVGAVSDSNELGMFAMKPRRLGDLKLLTNVRTARSPKGRMVWTGDFPAPMTAKRFLSDPSAQYQAFVASMKDYVNKLRSGEIARPDGGRPDGMTLSGVLAVLHRCGPSGLKTWNNENDRFPDTIALYGRTNGIF